MGAAFKGCRIPNRVAFWTAYVAPYHFFEVGIPLFPGYGVIPLREYWHERFATFLVAFKPSVEMTRFWMVSDLRRIHAVIVQRTGISGIRFSVIA